MEALEILLKVLLCSAMLVWLCKDMVCSQCFSLGEGESATEFICAFCPWVMAENFLQFQQQYQL